MQKSLTKKYGKCNPYVQKLTLNFVRNNITVCRKGPRSGLVDRNSLVLKLKFFGLQINPIKFLEYRILPKKERERFKLNFGSE
jgi:hypothetical protein